MYTTLYFLIKFNNKNNKNNKYSYEYSNNIDSQLILITFDKDDIYNYFNNDKIPDNFIINEFIINNCKDFFKFSDVYILFNCNLDNNLFSQEKIIIVDILFDYNEMINYITDMNLLVAAKFNINKTYTLLYNSPITKINFIFQDVIYKIDSISFQKSQDITTFTFLSINDIKLPFPYENITDFINKLSLYQKYNLEQNKISTI